MIDEEVEIVLREIRERVTSQPLASGSPPGTNGNQNSQLLAVPETSAHSTEAMARLNAHLTTTARAWDRLPPVFSNRSGTAARIEVWLKARLKIFSRWFTWEQINFNAAVHHALGETSKTLAAHEAVIAALRSQLAENEALRAEVQAQRDEIDELRAQNQADSATRKLDLQNQQREANAFRAQINGEVETMRIQSADWGAELRARIETIKTEAVDRLASELREREDRIENEQRVCFKQLSLETNETAVSVDRARQRMNALLEEMDQRIKQLEASEQPKSGS